MTKPKLATTWLDGCSGCHMSLLDMDEKLIDLAAACDIVYSPLVDIKEFPEGVDVTLVEGAVSSEHDLHKIQTIRQRTKILVALGDCGVTSNVPAMRNAFSVDSVLKRGYSENGATGAPPKCNGALPVLLPKARPIHEVVKVDLYIPGCPPSAATIHYAVSELLAGRIPDMGSETRFGA
jgi:NAD-reducing hydrogenase small subunit